MSLRAIQRVRLALENLAGLFFAARVEQTGLHAELVVQRHLVDLVQAHCLQIVYLLGELLAALSIIPLVRVPCLIPLKVSHRIPLLLHVLQPALLHSVEPEHQSFAQLAHRHFK